MSLHRPCKRVIVVVRVDSIRTAKSPTAPAVGAFLRMRMEVRVNLDAYLTRSQASLLTGVSPDSIGKWHARGWLTAAGERRHLSTKPGPGKNLRYRLGDILEAERDTRINPNSRRPASPHLLAA